MQALENLTCDTTIAVRFQIGKQRRYRWYVGKIKFISNLRPGMLDDGDYRETFVQFNDGQCIHMVLFTSNFHVKERGAWTVLSHKDHNDTKIPLLDSQIGGFP
jgi:hypothetical protein